MDWCVTVGDFLAVSSVGLERAEAGDGAVLEMTWT